MVSISLHARIASIAAYFSETYGAVPREARRRGVTRQAIHGQAVRFIAVVEPELRPGPSWAELLREVGELRRENRELRERLETAAEFPESRRREFAVHAVAMGSRLCLTDGLSASLTACNGLRAQEAGRWHGGMS